MLIKIPFTQLALEINAAAADEKKPLIFGRSTNYGAGGQRDMSEFRISFVSLFSAYRNNADIYGCVREWRENVGMAGYQWTNLVDPESDVDDATVKRLDGILNFDMPWRSLKSRIMRDLGVTGNCYMHKVTDGNGKVKGLQPIDPRTVTILSDKHGTILGYIQKFKQETQRFAPEEVMHFKLDTDPMNEVFGMSPLEPAIWEARTDAQAMLANYYFFENNALPAAQYILEDGMSKEEIEAAESMIEKSLKGAQNNNRSAVFTGIKEIKTLGISQKDMEFLQGRKFTTEKICAAFGVPKFMLGYTDTVNNNNGVELTAKAHESTFEPLEQLVASTITRELLEKDPETKDRVGFEFLPRLFEQEAEIERRALAEWQAGALTLRQYKRKTNQEITPEDEQKPNFDEYILHNGASAVLLEDVGADPIMSDGNPEAAQNLLKVLDEFKNRFKAGQSNSCTHDH